MTKSVTHPKINLASYKVLSTLQALFRKNLTMTELVNALEEYGYGPYNNFVASKYVHTCKSCGIDIQKIEGKYSLINMPIGQKFTDNEVELLFEFKEFSEKQKNVETDIELTKFLKKLHITYFKSGNGLCSSENYRIIKLFEKARNSNYDVKLFHKNGKEKDCTPKGLYANNNRIIMQVSDSGGDFEVNPDDLVNIRITTKNSLEPIKYDEVIFELRGKLAKRYQLRENEQILKVKPNGDIVVLNKYEDKKQLLRRLMRYSSLCVIKKPESYVTDFVKMIDTALNNYD